MTRMHYNSIPETSNIGLIKNMETRNNQCTHDKEWDRFDQTSLN